MLNITVCDWDSAFFCLLTRRTVAVAVALGGNTCDGVKQGYSTVLERICWIHKYLRNQP